VNLIKEKVDLARLNWTKNVNHPDPTKWAYGVQEISYPYLFPELRLHWARGEHANARRVPKEDLILLRQRTKVTHIVMPIDNELHEIDQPDHPHPIYRLVQVMWIQPHFEKAPDQNTVFDFPLKVEGGDVVSLNAAQFVAKWGGLGGLPALQAHIAEALELFKR